MNDSRRAITLDRTAHGALALLLIVAACTKKAPSATTEGARAPVWGQPGGPRCPDKAQELVAGFYPQVCASWDEQPGRDTQSLLGNYEVVSLGGKRAKGRVKVTTERIWFSVEEEGKTASGGSPRGPVALKAWFHPTVRQLCVDFMMSGVALKISEPRPDGTLLVTPIASPGVTIQQGDLVVRKVDADADMALSPPSTVGDAIREGTVADLERLLARSPPPLSPGDPTPLQIAVHEMQLPMVELLLAKGADLEATSPSETSWHPIYRRYRPLAIAIQNRHFRMVQRLLKAGAKLQAGKEESAFAEAVMAPDFMPPEILELLLRAGVHWQGDRNVEYQLPRKEDLLGLLLCHGLDPNSAMSSGESMLNQTIVEGSLGAFKRLLAAKVDVSRPDGKGETPLMVAVDAEKVEVVRALFDAGATVGPDDAKGILEGGLSNPTLLAELLKHGVSANTDMDGQSLKAAATERR